MSSANGTRFKVTSLYSVLRNLQIAAQDIQAQGNGTVSNLKGWKENYISHRQIITSTLHLVLSESFENTLNGFLTSCPPPLLSQPSRLLVSLSVACDMVLVMGVN